MNWYRCISLVLFICFIVLTIVGVYQGDISVGIIVFIPFLIGSGLFASIGFLCLFLAVFVYVIGLFRSIPSDDVRYHDVSNVTSSKKSTIKTGGVILIGPIPIVFGSNWKITLLLVIVAVIFLLLFYYFFSQFFLI